MILSTALIPSCKTKMIFHHNIAYSPVSFYIYFYFLTIFPLYLFFISISFGKFAINFFPFLLIYPIMNNIDYIRAKVDFTQIIEL